MKILLLLALANPDNLSWFPVSGIQDASTFNPEWSIWMKTKHRLPYLILPIITYTYGSFAFLSRIMRIGMIDVVSQDYIRTARAKGLRESTSTGRTGGLVVEFSLGKETSLRAISLE